MNLITNLLSCLLFVNMICFIKKFALLLYPKIYFSCYFLKKCNLPLIILFLVVFLYYLCNIGLALVFDDLLFFIYNFCYCDSSCILVDSYVLLGFNNRNYCSNKKADEFFL